MQPARTRTLFFWHEPQCTLISLLLASAHSPHLCFFSFSLSLSLSLSTTLGLFSHTLTALSGFNSTVAAFEH